MRFQWRSRIVSVFSVLFSCSLVAKTCEDALALATFQLTETLNEQNFTQNRTLKAYEVSFGPKFLSDRSSLHVDDVWTDMGSGDGLALLKYANTTPSAAKIQGVAFNAPKSALPRGLQAT